MLSIDRKYDKIYIEVVLYVRKKDVYFIYVCYSFVHRLKSKCEESPSWS